MSSTARPGFRRWDRSRAWRTIWLESFWNAARSSYLDRQSAKRLPHFELRDTAGRVRTTSEIVSGLPCILVVTSPHCAPCKAVYPLVKSLAERAGSGARVVLLSRGARETNRTLQTDHGLEDVIVLGSRASLERELGVAATPFALLISPEGQVVSKGVATLEKLERYLSLAISPLLYSTASGGGP